MKYMDIYYLHLIMDCQWRCARSEANINPVWHYFVCLFIFLNTSYCFQSCMCRFSRHMKEGKKVREGGEGINFIYIFFYYASPVPLGWVLLLGLVYFMCEFIFIPVENCMEVIYSTTLQNKINWEGSCF